MPHGESSLQCQTSNGDLSSPSSTETTFSQAKDTSSSMLPYLEMPGLTEAEKSALRGRLIRESRQIMLKFNKLLQSTIESLIQQGVTPKKLARVLMSLEALIGDQQLPLESIDDIFQHLSSSISFMNYDVIEHIIESLGTEMDKSNLKDYKAELKEYCKRRVSECPHNKPCAPGNTTVVIKLDKSLNKIMLSDIDLFRDKLSRILQIESHTLVFLRVEKGCTQITFQIPSVIVDSVFPLSREQEESLKEERVMKLVCGVYTYSYPLKVISKNCNVY